MRVLELLTDGGTAERPDRHYECRHCGRNLSPDVSACPECGGEIAVHTL